MQTELDDIETISRLKFIGCIQPGEKINVPGLYVQKQGIITILSRTIYPDNRYNAVIFIRETVESSINLLKKYKSKDINTNNILKDFRNSVKGIGNLKKTYFDDVKICCDLEALIEIVNDTITKNEIIDE